MRQITHAQITIAVVAALALTSACSKPGAASGGGKTIASAATGNACDRHLITQADVAPLLSQPISTVKPLAGDPQSCVFETAEYTSVTVMLRPGMGDETVAMWIAGKMNVPAQPISGVGDKAAWVPELKEVVASKNNVLCDIGGGGGPDTEIATQAKVGALCNKIFAGL